MKKLNLLSVELTMFSLSQPVDYESLTDEQMSAIFSYAQTGATALQPFH